MYRQCFFKIRPKGTRKFHFYSPGWAGQHGGYLWWWWETSGTRGHWKAEVESWQRHDVGALPGGSWSPYIL